MAANIITPWKIHLRGSRRTDGGRWWTRKKYRDDQGVHPSMMKEQDLDHLGALHEKTVHFGKQ